VPARTNPTLRGIAKETCRRLRKSQTPAELALWEALRDRKFRGLKFYRQYPLFVDWLQTQAFFVADFFCFEKRLAIEVDGRLHDYQPHHDDARTFIIKQMGIRVIRVRNEEVERSLSAVLDRLAEVLRDAPSCVR